MCGEIGVVGVDEERHGFNHGRNVAQYRHHHLFAVAKRAVRRFDAETDERCIGIGSVVDADSRVAHCLEGEVERFRCNHVAGAWVEKFDYSVHRSGFIAFICHVGSERGFVAGAQESRHIGFHHNWLAAHCVALQTGKIAVCCVSQRLHKPGGVEVGHFKFHLIVALLIGDQIRHPKSGFNGVFAQLDIVEGIGFRLILCR